MDIQCDKCRTIFDIDETLLKDGGSKVKCSRCNNVFLAFPAKKAEYEDQKAVGVSEEEPGLKEETFDAALEEESDFDGILEEADMEDIEALEADYEADRQDLEEEIDFFPDDIDESVDETFTGTDDTGRDAAPGKKTSRSNTLLIFAVIIVALFGIAFAVTKWAPDLVPDFLKITKTKPDEKQQRVDMGASRLEILTVNGSFVYTKKGGRLFVIRGKVVNGYPESRSFILIKGNILDDKGQVVTEKSAYAGNPLKEDELLDLPYEEINNVMSNRPGINNKNLNIEPGTSVDFAIVFENLPDNISEFTVGAVSSSPASPEADNG